jgi:hypothetical protein
MTVFCILLKRGPFSGQQFNITKVFKDFGTFLRLEPQKPGFAGLRAFALRPRLRRG